MNKFIWILILTFVLQSFTIQSRDVTTVLFGGSTVIQAMLNELIQEYSYIRPDLKMSHSPMLGSLAICRLLNYTAECNQLTDTKDPKFLDAAYTETVISTTFQNKYKSEGVIMLPFVSSAVVVAYNIPNLGNNTLVLSPPVISRIFRKCNVTKGYCASDTIFRWDDPAILALNPAITQQLIDAGEIYPIVRADSSGVTNTFKKALSASDPLLKVQMPVDSSINWGNGSMVIYAAASNEVGLLRSMSSSITYSPLPRAIFAKMAYASIQRTDATAAVNAPIVASVFSTDASFTELGPNSKFSQYESLKRANPTLAESQRQGSVFLTSDTFNAYGSTAYPFVLQTYVLIKTKVGRQDEIATCDQRKAVLDFLLWFYTNSVAHKIAINLGYSVLGPAAADSIMQMLKESFLCEGKQVNLLSSKALLGTSNVTAASIIPIFVTPGTLPAVLRPIINSFEFKSRLLIVTSSFPHYDAFASTSMASSAEATSAVRIAVGPVFDIFDDKSVFSSDGGTTPAEESLLKARDLSSTPVGLVGIGILYNLCPTTLPCSLSSSSLRLSASVIIKILNGEITQWNDPAISEMNPTVTTLPAATIAVLPVLKQWKYSIGKSLETITNSSVGTVTFSAATAGGSSVYSIEADLAFGVKSLGYSFAILPSTDTTLQYAHVLTTDGLDYVQPTSTNLEACAAGSTFKDVNNPRKLYGDGFLPTSDSLYSKLCYSLSVPIYISIKRDWTSVECGSTTDIAVAAKFIQSLFGLTSNGFAIGIESDWTFEKIYSNFNFVSSNGVRKLQDNRDTVTNVMRFWGIGSLILVNFNSTSESLLMRARLMNEIELIKCSSKNVSLVLDPVDLNAIPVSISFGFSFFAICWGCFQLYTGYWIWKYSNTRLIHNASPRFLLLMIFGCFLGMLSISFLPFDEGRIVSEYNHLDTKLTASTLYNFHDVLNKGNRYLDVYCSVSYWLIGLGFAIMITSIYVKIWRIVRLFQTTRRVKQKFSDENMLRLQMVLISIPVVQLIVGQVLAPLYFKRTVLEVGATENVLASVGNCQTDRPSISLAPIAFTFLLAILYGNYLAYQCRNIPTEFQEGQYIALSLLFILQAFLFGIPLIQFTAIPLLLFFAKAYMLFVVFGVTHLFVIIPKILVAYGYMTVTSMTREEVLKDMSENSKSNSSKDKKSNHGPSSQHQYSKPGGSREGGNNTNDLKFGSGNNTVTQLNILEVSPNKNSMKINMKNGSFDDLLASARSTAQVNILKSSRVSVESKGTVNDDDAVITLAISPTTTDNADNIDPERGSVDLDRAAVAPWILQKPPTKKNKNVQG